MDRRNFLKGAMAFGASCAMPMSLRSAPLVGGGILLHLYLDGGPDFRQLMAPSSSTDYGRTYWNHRYPTWGLNSRTGVTTLEGTLLPGTSEGIPFYFHPLADWLHREWELGRVAVVNQVLGSDKRNHEFGSIVMETGSPISSPGDRQRSGWGGRLAREMNQKVVSLTSRVRQFSYGPSEIDPLSHDNRDVLSIHDMRQFGLFRPESLESNPSHGGYRESLTRALGAYYQSKVSQISTTSPYRPIGDHYEKLSHQGALVRERLAGVESDVEMQKLVSGEGSVANRGFARQCSNFLDASHCLDILDASVFSMGYGGFDTHRDQSNRIGERFGDIFGSQGPLATMMTSLRANSPELASRVLIMVSGEFGRQLAANGDQGTDHGRGNSVILMGDGVNGGMYGDLFPEEEIDRYGLRGSDIHGVTGVEHVVHKISESLKNGSGNQVVPDLSSSDRIQDSSVLDFLG